MVLKSNELIVFATISFIPVEYIREIWCCAVRFTRKARKFQHFAHRAFWILCLSGRFIGAVSPLCLFISGVKIVKAIFGYDAVFVTHNLIGQMLGLLYGRHVAFSSKCGSI